MSITIESVISIIPDDNMVSVDGEILHFEISHPETIKGIPWEKIHAFYWNDAEINKIGWYADVLYGKDYKETPLEDSDFETVIKPFVDQWQAEKDRIEQEQQQEQEEYNKFENRQARALIQLNEDFETVKQRAHIKSSLGFTIDANQTANENIRGLLVTISETETIQFCDYYNKFRELNKSQLQILQTELITNAQNLYQQKWQYRHAIEDCVDNEGLDGVLATIEFTYMDFTPTGEGETETGEQA